MMILNSGADWVPKNPNLSRAYQNQSDWANWQDSLRHEGCNPAVEKTIVKFFDM